jgi:hypothetical protein
MVWRNYCEKKYTLVAWSIVCKDKTQGGLEIMNLDIMNKILLAKWIVIFRDSAIQGY